MRVDDDGELWVRNATLFDGYLDDPEATAACCVDGWYRTGDLADEDDEGYLRIVGRAGDVIRTGGETVAPGRGRGGAAGPSRRWARWRWSAWPTPAWGEVVCAVVVVAPGADAPDLDDLRTLCAARLAPFKHPRRRRWSRRCPAPLDRAGPAPPAR